MQRPHWTQPSCSPLRMSTPVGQTATHWLQSMQSPAGSPADLLVNGRLIARGEVVVIDEDFGLRITEIVTDATAG